jgi:hypothetical protein
VALPHPELRRIRTNPREEHRRVRAVVAWMEPRCAVLDELPQAEHDEWLRLLDSLADSPVVL